MNNSIVNPNNGKHAAPNVAERHAEQYRQAGKPSRPGLWAKVRPYLLAGAAGLIIGASVAFAASDQLAPLPGSVRVSNGVVTIENDGSRAFLVNGWIVPIPKAPGQ